MPAWAAALLVVACGAAAQPTSSSVFTGQFSVGLRGVEIDGSETKYREDLDYGDGPRIVDLDFTFVADTDDSNVDRIDVNVDNLGNEPFQSAQINVRKYGGFDLKIDRRKSRYFYDDTIIPTELAVIEASTGGDFHTFDFERVRDTAELKMHLSPATQLSFDLAQYTRIGNSITTLDVQRDEFELDKAIDDSSRTVGLSIQHSWNDVTIVFEERIDDFESDTESVLPGFSPGENLADPTTLSFFQFAQPYDFSSRTHRFKVLTSPTDRLRVNAGWQSSDLDLDMLAREEASGTTFSGNPFTSSLLGGAQSQRDSDILDIDVAARANDRVSVLFAIRDSELTQSGQSMLDADAGATNWSVETRDLELGVEVAIGSSMLLSGGLSAEDRDVVLQGDAPASFGRRAGKTQRDGYFVRLTFEPVGPLSVTASIEDDAIDDPYALSAPTNSQRFRIGARYQWNSGISLNASYRQYDLENDLSQWRGETEQVDFRVNGMHSAVQWSAGIGIVEYSRSVDQVVAGGSRQDLFQIDYLTESDFADGSVRWQVGDRISVGATAAFYDGEGSRDIERDDWRTFVEFAAGNDYLMAVSFRDIDYSEDLYDDYDARILEVSVGLRW